MGAGVWGGFESEAAAQGILRHVLRVIGSLTYAPGDEGEPISLSLPVREAAYEFDGFPLVFEGVLLEGLQLEAFLRRYKVDMKYY